MRGRKLGRTYELADVADGEDAAPLAVATPVGRKDWTITAGRHEYRFRRGSFWRGDQLLLVWKAGAIADLPGLPPPLQVFVVAVVLRMWDAQAAAGASAG